MERISVTIHAADPLSGAGLASFIGRLPGIDLFDELKQGSRHRSEPVAILLTDRLDHPVGQLLRKLTDQRSRLVLVASPLRRPELVTVVERGVRVIVWRHHITPERLARAVRAADRGEVDLPSDAVGFLATLVGQRHQGSPAAAMADLSGREIDVLRLLAEGMEIREIAEKLSYSERTVKYDLHRLITRLELRNRTHAVAYAIREGYLRSHGGELSVSTPKSSRPGQRVEDRWSPPTRPAPMNGALHP